MMRNEGPKKGREKLQILRERPLKSCLRLLSHSLVSQLSTQREAKFVLLCVYH